MEQILEPEIDLFADALPSLEDIKKLSEQVHSSEKNLLNFEQKVESKTSSTSANTLIALGIGYYILGKNNQAVEKLQKGKDCMEKFIYLAFALRKTDKFDEAIKNLRKSLDYEVDKVSISLEKAQTYRCAGDFEAAAKELRACANFENVSSEYHYQLGYLEEAQGFYDKAIDNYKIAVELSPNHQKALFRLAYRCDLLGDEEAAIGYYIQIAAHSPAYINALLNLAVLYEDSGEFDKASQCVDIVLEYYPNHKRAGLFRKDIASSKTMFYDEEKEKKKTRKNKILETPISDFELSVRSRNCLKKMNIQTLGDLLNITEAELLSYKNFGETSLKEVKAILESKGMSLGMALEEKSYNTVQNPDTTEISQQEQIILSKPIDDLQLSVRARKCLQKLNVRAINELVSRTEAELLGCKNFGVTSLNEIKKSLGDLGLSLRNLD